MPDFVHPETGELLATEEDWRAALDEAAEKLGHYYRLVVWPLREAHAERFPPGDLPARRYRTDTQEKVARCPRCGQTYQEEDQ